MVNNIILTYEEKTFNQLERLKNKVKKISGMKVFSWENFVLDQIYNK